MFRRGDIVIFRPKEVINDGFYPKSRDLNIGIVTAIKYDFILEGNNSCEQRKELLTLRVVGGFRPTVHYPDRLDTSIRFTEGCTSPSFGWYHARREFLANDIAEQKTNHKDIHIDFGRAHASHITDLHVKYASLDTDESSIDELLIRQVEAGIHVHRPSTFHRKLGALRSYWLLCLLWETLNRWKEYVARQLRRKLKGSIMIQKHVRRYLERDSIRIQRQWVKWWSIQKDFWCDYVDPNIAVSCYNMRGTRIYFSTKFAADRWSDRLQCCLNNVATHALKSSNDRLKETLRKWKLSIYKQKAENDTMSLEDLASSFL